jgi:hypothetical protein
VPALEDIIKAIGKIIEKVDKLSKDPLFQKLVAGDVGGAASIVNEQAVSGVEQINADLLSWFEQKAKEWGFTSIFGGPTTPAAPAPPAGATGGGTPISGAGANNITINVQNPITNNSDIPTLLSYLQRTYGGGG